MVLLSHTTRSLTESAKPQSSLCDANDSLFLSSEPSCRRRHKLFCSAVSDSVVVRAASVADVTQWCHTKDFGVLYTVLSVTGGTSTYRLPCSPSWSRDLWRHRQMTKNHHDVLLHTSNHATLPSLSCTANTVLICSIRITNNAIWSHLLATVIPINIRKPIGLSCLSVCENETSVSYSSS